MQACNKVLSGVVVPAVLLFCGIYFLCAVAVRVVRCRGAFCHAFSATAAKGAGGNSSLRALAVALAGTLGVGNIAGVASAVALGGAGAVFWMWISAALVMFVKYAEIVLAILTRQSDAEGRLHGGAMYYIKTAFAGRTGRVLAFVFATLCFACSLSLGGMVQSHAATEAMAGVFHVPPLACGGAIALLAAFVLWRGAARVEAVCAKLVPFVCLLFSVASLAVLWCCRAAVPAAFVSIFRGAFDVRSAAAGVGGYSVAAAVRYGVARGLVSHEAGCGTAPIAHAAAQVKTPAMQGFWGVFEVFIDTIVLCTMTALVLLVSGVPAGDGGVNFAIDAFRAVLGEVAGPLLALSLLFFAFATVLSWSHYGGESLAYLTGNPRAARLMAPLAALSVLLGSVCAPQIVWGLTDLVLSLMVLCNMAAVFCLRHKVVDATVSYLTAYECERQAADSRRRFSRWPLSRSSRHR